jgi:hypothetical protein
MPNWCDNVLTVEGPREALDRFRDAVKSQPLEATDGNGDRGVENSSDLSLERIIPTPEEMLTSKGFEEDGWYHWRINNWGTKWDVDAKLIEDGDRLIYEFSSAWSPPQFAIETASQQYPELTFTIEFDESGVDFWGYCVFRGGELIEDDGGPSITTVRSDDPNLDEDDRWEYLPLFDVRKKQ